MSKNPKEAIPEAYVPWVDGQPIACSSIYLPATPAANQYYVISAISAEEPGRAADSKAVLCNWADLYVGPDDWSGKSYYVLSYEDGEGFTQHMCEYVRGDSWMGVRGVRINETLYVICGDIIESYNLETFERTGGIDLFKGTE